MLPRLQTMRHSECAVISLSMSVSLGWQISAQAQEDTYVAPARYTVAREHTLEPTVKLPGTVRARHHSLIGSETEGMVVRLTVREGERLSQGDSIAQLRTDILRERLNAARSQLDATVASRELTRRSLDRAQKLFDDKSMSEQQLDELAYELQGWQAEERRLGAEIAQIELSIDHSHIRAPFDGVVVARHTDVGEWREAGDPIVELVSIGELEVDVAVPEIYFDELNVEGQAEVAFPSVSDQRFTYEIGAVVPMADAEARAFAVRIPLPEDPDRPALAVGFLADVWLSVGRPTAVTIVPKDAIVRRQQEQMVVLIDSQNQTRISPVLTGASVGEWIEIKGDVASGDRVIVRGNERLEAAQTVDATLLEYGLP